MNRKPVVGILLGSDSDYEIMIEAAKPWTSLAFPSK
jgi:phosphoribosylcarboxyaminoimidazole (NCAIR) mutase